MPTINYPYKDQEFSKMRLLLITLVISSLFISNLEYIQASETQKTTIIYVSNLPDIESHKKGGIANISTMVNDVRDSDNSLIFLHGGDSLGPSTLGSFDRGSHMIDILNIIEPTVMAVSKREFSYRENELTLRASEAIFPVISTNIVDSVTGGNLEGIAKSHMEEIGDFKIGIIASVALEVVVDYSLKDVKIADPIKTAVKEAASLRGKGADMIIAMFDFDDKQFPALIEAGTFDIILSTSRNGENRIKQTNGILVHLPSEERNFVSMNLTLSRNKQDKIDIEVNTIINEELKTVLPDPDITEVIEDYMQRLSQLMDIKIGKTTTILDSRKELIRTSETALGNLIADALRDKMGADIGLMNAGGIRGNREYPAGTELLRRDINRELPFRNFLSMVKITGAQLRAALENGFSRIEDQKGRFPHVSGINVRYDSSAVVGQRVISIKINGKPIDAKTVYTLAAPDFIVGGGDGYTALKSGSLMSTSREILLWELLRAYIEKRGTIAPKIEGRLINVAP
jgi:5'-nucleotidase/UDP-sugar diphosphatase